MPRFVTGVVIEILSTREGISRLLVEMDGGATRRATAFTAVTGAVEVGDEVVINITGTELELGTGGDDFVLWNRRLQEAGELSGGHIVKLRYTPWQIDVVSAEAPESPHHEALASMEEIGGMPVVACGLHSQVAPIVASFKRRRPELRLAYLMTDGAALPLLHSDLVAGLVERNLLDATITCGHAFGGDLECVNLFSALAAAAVVVRADVCVVAMGPGVVGTGTALGHTEMEQGQAISAAAALGGRPVAAIRASFVEARERHRPVSHHTLSALTIAATTRSLVAVPLLPEDKLAAVLDALRSAGVHDRHDLVVVDISTVLDDLAHFDLHPETMGRSVEDDPDFFQSAGAAGVLAAELISR